MSRLQTRIVTEMEDLRDLSRPWRDLAYERGCPTALPEWLLAWWKHKAPPAAHLRVVTVLDGKRLVGLAPFFLSPGKRVEYRLLGSPYVHRLAPLSAKGMESEVIDLVASTLAEADPRPDLVGLDAVDEAASWPNELAAAWPGRLKPWRYTWSRIPAPVISLDGTYEEWFAARSANFRHQMRKTMRRLERNGGRIVLARGRAELAHACNRFAELHALRWQQRGEHSYLDSGWFAMVEEAAQSLAPRDELRLWTLLLDGQVFGVQLFLAAGGEVHSFASGWDPAVANYRPALLLQLAATEDAFARGERRLDLGGGPYAYKLRFATGNAPVVWGGLVPRTRRYPLVRARLAPAQARHLLHPITRRLPSGLRKQLKRMLKRS